MDEDSEGSPVRDASTHLTDKDGAKASKSRIIAVDRIDTETDYLETEGQDDSSGKNKIHFNSEEISGIEEVSVESFN